MGQPASTGVLTLYTLTRILKAFTTVERLRSPWFSTVHNSREELSGILSLCKERQATWPRNGAWDEMIKRLDAELQTVTVQKF